ncbi:MAG TPA: hypothetical protein DEB24_03420 [Coriobacteriia bacterium]|nr:hypothetical protein [Coriobacteriia bacterium]
MDMEALAEAEPDVIFIGGRLSEQYEALSRIAPVILVALDTKTDTFLGSLESNLNMFAEIFDAGDAVADYVADFTERVEALQKATAGETCLITMVSSGSVSVVGNNGRGTLIDTQINIENVAGEVGDTHGDSASFELLLDKNPDWIFAIDRDSAIGSEGAKAAKEILENEIVRGTDAHKNNRIVYLIADAWYLASGGIEATDIMLSDLEKGILK